MFNTIKELKAVEKSTNLLSETQILQAFGQGIIFSSLHVSEKDYKNAIKIWGFDMKATNQTFFDSVKEVQETSEIQLQLAKLIYYSIFEVELFKGNLISFTKTGEVDKLAKTLVKINVVDNLKPLLSKHIETIKTLTYDTEDYINLISEYDLKINVKNIKSRDLKLALMKHYNINFSTIQEIVKSFNGHTKNEGLFIISKKSGWMLSENEKNLIVNSILNMKESQIMKESATYRKELMLLKKMDQRLITKINRSLRNGKNNHIRKEKSFLEKATDNSVSIEIFEKNIKTLTNLQLFRLYSGINAAKNGSKYFLVKTGNLGINENRKSNNSAILNVKKNILRVEIANRFKNDKIKVILPEDITIALPTSYKNFIGNLPYFSSVPIKDEGSIGIIWHSKCDYDLSGITDKSQAIGFWGDTKWDDIFYSGDVRSPGKYGAAEYLAYGKNSPNFNIYVNLFDNYSHKPVAKIFATDTKEFEVKNSPKFVLPVEDFSGQIGTKINNKFILGGMSSVTNTSRGNLKNAVESIEFMKNKYNEVLSLNELINLANWSIVEKNYKPENDEIIYNFSLDKLSKQTFIDIFGE